MSRKKKKFTGKRFIQIYHWEMELPAYRLMTPYGRSLILEFRRYYNGSNNGKITMSIRQAAKLLNCNKDTAAKILKELQDKGWIVQTSKGRFDQKTNKTASTWRITNQPIGYGVNVPETKEYAKWRPAEGKQNAVPRNRTNCATTSHSKSKGGPVKSDRTPPNCPNTSDRDPLDIPSDGPIKPDICISTNGDVAQLEERQ